MERFLMDDLVGWKNSVRRKPLVLNGARQVGKTWLLMEFGARHFESVAYVNLDNNLGLASQFDVGYDLPRILLMIQAESGQRVIPGKTLVVLDEVQECPKALTSLKYFCENAPELAVVAAGSLLGITFHEGTGYPVGKVDMLDLHPLSFREFLDATGNPMLREVVDSGDKQLLGSLAAKFRELLKQYYFVGGMPEAVATFVESADLSAVRAVQEGVLFGYERDISKHLGAAGAERALSAWRSLPAHLGQENKKFVFGHIGEGARARDYRSAITWLTQAGIATRVPRVSKPGVPLSAYADESAFKLFSLDVGLLCALSRLDASSIVDGNALFTEFRGALTEQYVCQQLVSDCNLSPCYWSAENSRGEVDFLVQRGGRVYPIEVKAEENLRSKSLRAFSGRYPGTVSRRFSLSGFCDQGWMRNVPLYAIGNSGSWD
ncbi:ATPase [Olsenella sp. oral taxon 807]|uniref:ATP-binding protein n=1 Tax=Olsenella sp. oral taxon 807 TaxID=712411 RepID=UPI00067A405D|nr:ATP-binding protein [Olsenella sp. oral taxon 807]AKT48113.1 ATPase [Olsenella sp. oral taxon 807]